MLAIAGLVFLVAFVAVPALQRGQRDGARKSYAGVVAGLLNTYKSNKGRPVCADTVSTGFCGYQETPDGSSGASYMDFVNNYLRKTDGTTEFDDSASGFAITSPHYARGSTNVGALWVLNASIPPGFVIVFSGATCSGNQVNNATTTTIDRAVWVKLEQGGAACVQV